MGKVFGIRHDLLIGLLLVLVTIAVFWQVFGHEFVYDDKQYIVDNPAVRAGLSVNGFVWAVASMYAFNWHPLTWLSHMADCSLFGINALPHHLVNLLLHAANAVLLFLLLARMTGSVWRSGFVAALFAVHPLHVESVAWVAERKDVLSTLLGLLTVRAYVRYSEFKVQGSRFKVRAFVPVIVLFAMSLLSKPMLVTLPFVLLLLDYWPLNRVGAKHLQGTSSHSEGLPANALPLHVAGPTANALPSGECGRIPAPTDVFTNPESRIPPVTRYSSLVTEKIPLFVLSALSGIITYVAQHKGGAVAGLEEFPFSVRVTNALVSYIAYIWKMIVPTDLAVFYPHSGPNLPVWQVIGSTLMLVIVTALAILLGRRHRYLAVGWLWYLGTLVPVIGLVQVGMQSMADRYTYFPLVGLFIMLGWGIPELVKEGMGERENGSAPSSPIRPFAHSPILIAVVCSVLLALGWTARAQVAHWRNNTTLFEHTLKVTRGNYLMENNLGFFLMEQGKLGEAAKHFRAALKINPRYGEAHVNLGNILSSQGRDEAALREYLKAVEANPRLPQALFNLGTMLEQQGKLDEAFDYYKRAAEAAPDCADFHANLGRMHIRFGRMDQAMAEFQKAVAADPSCAEAHQNLGLLLLQQGRPGEAVPHFEAALKLDPNNAAAHLNLGAIMVDQQRVGEGIGHYLEALRIKPDFAEAHHNLAIAYYFTGDYAQAWQEVELCRKYGMDPNPDFLRALSEKMPQP